MAAGPKARMLLVAGGAALDTLRWSPAVLPMAALAFAGPWIGLFQLQEAFHLVGPETALFVFGAMAALGGAMQSLLLEIATGSLRPARARWRLDAVAIARRLAVDLGLNLASLVLVAVAAALGGLAVGIGFYALVNKGDGSLWGALGGAIVGGALVSFGLCRWAVAPAAAHAEGLGLVDALQRSVELTRGQRLRIGAAQAAYLCAWPALFFSAVYLSEKAAAQNLSGDRDLERAIVEVTFAVLGVLAGLEAFAKVRLYRELATLEGEVGQARVLEVFT